MLKYGVRNAFRNAFWPSVFGTFLLPWKLRFIYIQLYHYDTSTNGTYSVIVNNFVIDFMRKG